jgi:hypothetical protein
MVLQNKKTKQAIRYPMTFLTIGAYCHYRIFPD